MRKSYLIICILPLLFAGMVGCSRTCPPEFQAESWEQADSLFRRDAHWVGGDGAYSIDLGGGRVLWLFADSGIDLTDSHSRTSVNGTVISNAVAIQYGYDPSTADLRFFWRKDDEGRMTAFFQTDGSAKYWPGHAIRIRDRLILFLMKVKNVPTGWGFEVYDWDAVLVRNPEDKPTAWVMSWLDTPENDLQVIVGSASVLAEGGYVYAFSSREPGGGDTYLVRWPEDRVYEGNLQDMEWWNEGDTWTVYDNSGGRPDPVLRRSGTEFTIHFDRESGCWLQVHTVGFGPALLSLRYATALTGPWSDEVTIYRPPEFDEPRIMIYQGKAHPHLHGADLVLTYSTNSSDLHDFQGLGEIPTIYYPRFVRLSRE